MPSYSEIGISIRFFAVPRNGPAEWQHLFAKKLKLGLTRKGRCVILNAWLVKTNHKAKGTIVPAVLYRMERFRMILTERL